MCIRCRFCSVTRCILRATALACRFPCLHAPGANLLDPPLHLALQLRQLHIAEVRVGS